jgi:hypothetical protein
MPVLDAHLPLEPGQYDTPALDAEPLDAALPLEPGQDDTPAFDAEPLDAPLPLEPGQDDTPALDAEPLDAPMATASNNLLKHKTKQKINFISQLDELIAKKKKQLKDLNKETNSITGKYNKYNVDRRDENAKRNYMDLCSQKIELEKAINDLEDANMTFQVLQVENDDLKDEVAILEGEVLNLQTKMKKRKKRANRKKREGRKKNMKKLDNVLKELKQTEAALEVANDMIRELESPLQHSSR